MDNLRLILTITLLFLGLSLYQAWQNDYGPRPATASAAASESGTAAVAEPAANAPDRAELPQTRDSSASALPPGGDETAPGAGRLTVKTDVLSLELSLLGGDIRRLELPTYPVALETPDIPFRLLNDSGSHYFVAQSGLLSDQADTAPTHQSPYRSQHSSYQLADGQDQLEVELVWDGPNGVRVFKTYSFKRGDYAVSVRHRVENGGDQPWQGRLYSQLQRSSDPGVPQSKLLYTYLGGAIATAESHYQKISFDDIESNRVAQDWPRPWAGGWLAMLQHYFVAAIVPPAAETQHYYSTYLSDNGRYLLGAYGETRTVAPGQNQNFEFEFYAGPKLQHRLEQLSPALELTVDYGWLWFISQPLFWLLEQLHHLLGNWGWAIVVLTILLKLAFFQLSATSYKSMANMRRMQPRMVALKERYANDRAGLNQAMMDLYRKEKINPLGGCLPILVQIPVFIALYWVLLESVELRQAPFMLWITDMSRADPYFVLPLIMGATMVLQQKLNPAPLDPIQQKVMMILPLVFTVFFAFFPSGLVLYWVANNVLSIAQQWYITKKIAGDTL